MIRAVAASRQTLRRPQSRTTAERERDRLARIARRRGRRLRAVARRRRWRRLFPLVATTAVAAATWLAPGGMLGPATTPCATPQAAKPHLCLAGTLPSGARPPTTGHRDRDPETSAFPGAPEAGGTTGVGGIGLPGLAAAIGALGLLGALGAGLSGRPAAREAQRWQPAVASVAAARTQASPVAAAAIAEGR